LSLFERGKHGFLLPLLKGDREGFQERVYRRVLVRRSLPYNISPLSFETMKERGIKGVR
jgi:hypothetical protein